MPIVNIPANPPQPTPPKPLEKVSVTSPDYRHSVVDTKITPLASLISHVSGSSIVGDYYSQVVSADEELSEFQPNQLAPYQQYHLIKDLESKLQGSLNTSIDSATGVATITGSAIIYPKLTPNRGDVYILDTGDGRAGQFTVTNITILSLFKETCYEIDIELSRYVDQALIDNINSKVVKTSVFHKDFLVYGQNPIIAEESLVALKELKALENTILNHWINSFYSVEFSTFMVPGQEGATYDPYVTRMFFHIYNTTDHRVFNKVKIINVDGVKEANQLSIFDVLLQRDISLLPDVFRTPFLIDTGSFSTDPLLKSARYSGARYVVGAKKTLANVDDEYAPIPTLTTGIEMRELNDYDFSLASGIYNNLINDFVYPGEEALPSSSVFVTEEVPYLHAIRSTSPYVFSPSFYDNDVNGYSKFEHLVKVYLNDGTINRTVLYGFCNSFQSWGRLEKFYYMPVLLILIKVAQRIA